jgi:peptide/nickel transport system substrate-binding protein
VSGTPWKSPASQPVSLQPDYLFRFAYYQVDFNNPLLGPVFRQLYVRQALEYVADQAGIAKTIDRGYAYTTTGPVPTEPPSKWIPPVELGAGPYPFSIAKAVSLLTSHGWAKAGGVMTCTAPARCGPGIAKGQQLKMTLDYSTARVNISDLVAQRSGEDGAENRGLAVLDRPRRAPLALHPRDPCADMLREDLSHSHGAKFRQDISAQVVGVLFPGGWLQHMMR